MHKGRDGVNKSRGGLNKGVAEGLNKGGGGGVNSE